MALTDWEISALEQLTLIADNTVGGFSDSVSKASTAAKTNKEKKLMSEYERILGDMAEAAKMSKSREKDSKKYGKEQKTLLKEELKNLKGEDDFLEQKTNYLKKQEKNAKDEKARIAVAGSVMQKMGSTVSNAMESVTSKITAGGGGTFGKLTTGISKLGVGGQVVGAALGGLGIVVGWTAGKFMNLLEATSDLTKSGLAVRGGFFGVAKSATNLNMGFAEFAEFATKYTRTMAIAGSKFTTSVKAVEGTMLGVGMTTKETAEYMAEYLETQRLSGLLTKSSVSFQMSSGAELAKQQQRLATAFGKNVKEIQNATKGAYDSSQVQAQVMAMTARSGKDIKGAYDNAIAAFSVTMPELGPMFSEIFGAAQPHATKAYQDLLALGGQDAADALVNVANATKAGLPTEDLVMKLKDKLAALDIDPNSSTRILAQFGEGGEMFLNSVLAAKRAEAVASSKELKDALDKRNAGLEESARIRNMFDQFSNLGNKFFTALLKGINGGEEGTGIADMFGAISKAGNDLATWFTNWIENNGGIETIGTVIGKMMDSLSNFVNWLMALPNTFDSIMNTMSFGLYTTREEATENVSDQNKDTEGLKNDLAERKKLLASGESWQADWMLENQISGLNNEITRREQAVTSYAKEHGVSVNTPKAEQITTQTQNIDQSESIQTSAINTENTSQDQTSETYKGTITQPNQQSAVPEKASPFTAPGVLQASKESETRILSGIQKGLHKELEPVVSGLRTLNQELRLQHQPR